MEIKVTLVLEAGSSLTALLGGLSTGAKVAATAASPAKQAVAKEQVTGGTPKVSEEVAAEVAKSTPAPKAAAKAPVAKAASPAPKAAAKPVAKVAEGPAFEDLDEDGQLEAIKAHVTRQTKNSKSADVKAMLAHFDVSRASELAPEQYEGFHTMITRFGKGETVADLIAEGEEDLS